MSEPKKDVLKIHFSDNEACDPKIVTALRHIMEEAGVSRPAAARRLMALGCLAVDGQDARQAVETVLCRNAREMWRIAGLLQASEPDRDSEARSSVIRERTRELDSSSARRADEGSAGNIASSCKQEHVTAPAELPHAGGQLALSPAVIVPFSEDKWVGVPLHAEDSNGMIQPISKLGRALLKFREANMPRE